MSSFKLSPADSKKLEAMFKPRTDATTTVRDPRRPVVYGVEVQEDETVFQGLLRDASTRPLPKRWKAEDPLLVDKDSAFDIQRWHHDPDYAAANKPRFDRWVSRCESLEKERRTEIANIEEQARQTRIAERRAAAETAAQEKAFAREDAANAAAQAARDGSV